MVRSLIMADFDFLRDIRIQGRNAPLVSDKVRDQLYTHRHAQHGAHVRSKQ